MDSYYRDITCFKCITKSSVIYPDNDIQAKTCNNLMTFQSSISSIVIVIVGIFVWIMVRLPIGLPPAPLYCVLYISICEYFEKLTKLVT